MKKNHSQFVERLLHEMQLRNYSPRTIHTYGELMSKVENFFHFPIDKITTQQFKDYLHRRITQEGISTSCVNQYISAFKILHQAFNHKPNNRMLHRKMLPGFSASHPPSDYYCIHKHIDD